MGAVEGNPAVGSPAEDILGEGRHSTPAEVAAGRDNDSVRHSISVTLRDAPEDSTRPAEEVLEARDYENLVVQTLQAATSSKRWSSTLPGSPLGWIDSDTYHLGVGNSRLEEASQPAADPGAFLSCSSLGHSFRRFKETIVGIKGGGGGGGNSRSKVVGTCLGAGVWQC